MKIWFQNRRMKWKRSKKAQQEAKAKAAAAKKDKNGNNSSNTGKSTSAGSAGAASGSQAAALDDSASDLGEDILMNESDAEDLEEEEEIEVGVEETGHAPSMLTHAHAHSLFAPPPGSAPPGSLASHPGLHSPLASASSSIATPPGLRGTPLNLVNGHGHLNGLMAAAAAANRAAEQARSGDTPQGATPTAAMSSLLPTAAHLAKLGPNNRLYRPFVA